MVLDKPNAGTMVIVQGGERSSKSINKTMDGTAWKLRSSRHQHRPHKNTAYPNTRPYQHAEEGPPRTGAPSAHRSGESLELNARWRAATHQAKTPVQNADQNFHRRTADGEEVLDQEQARRHGQVRQQGHSKSQRRQGEADDRQVLEMPAVRFIPASIMSGG